jgi:hypothetical protein
MNKASWLPAHVYGNGYVGIGSKGICSWVIADTREILLLFTIQLTHALRFLSASICLIDKKGKHYLKTDYPLDRLTG